MSSSSHQASSSSSGVISGGIARRRGMPRICRCGETTVMRTSKTLKNPGRLFYCCPHGSEIDNYHLFRWTDECMVEEIQDLKEIVSELRGEVRGLRETVVACESEFGILDAEAKVSELIVSSYGEKIHGYEKDIEAMKSMLNRYEKEVEKFIGETRLMKNIMVCGFVLVGIIVYLYV